MVSKTIGQGSNPCTPAKHVAQQGQGESRFRVNGCASSCLRKNVVSYSGQYHGSSTLTSVRIRLLHIAHGTSGVASFAKGVNWSCNEKALLGRVKQIRPAKLQFTQAFLFTYWRVGRAVDCGGLENH